MLIQATYENALRDAWLSMVKNYPHLFGIEHYVEACNEVGILVF